MNGILVVNEYLNNSKFTQLNNWIADTAKQHNHNLTVVTNREIMIGINNNILKGAEYILFWDKDVLLASYLEKKGYRVFNSSDAIKICDDKALTYIELIESKICMPKTVIAPLTFSDYGNKPDFVDDVIEQLGLPLIVKERFGSFGKQVYLIKSKNDFTKILIEKSDKNLLFQEFISSSYGKDIRINVVGNNVVTSMYRYSDDDFRANVSNGASMKPYNPSKEETEMAICACKELKLDFAGVDILFGNNGKPILCEVNSNAHIINIYNCTHINVADYIFEYIERELR